MLKTINTKTVNAALLQHNSAKKAEPMTRENFYMMVRSRKVETTINAIEHQPEGADLRTLKSYLPAALYMAQYPDDGHRPKKDDSQPTGLCMHDFDHLETDVKAFFEEKVRPLADTLQLALAHITPSGKGLRLVTQMMGGEGIEACQQRVANMLGVNDFKDEHVKDICHLSYLVCESYILYINDALLFDIEVEEKEAETLPEITFPPMPLSLASVEEDDIEDAVIVEDNEEAEEVNYHSSEEAEETEECHDMVPVEVPEEPMYEGVYPLRTIVKKLEERIASQGLVQVGERNNKLYAMAIHLRALVRDNFQQLYDLLSPLFLESGLKDDEIRQTIASALGQRQKHPGRITMLMEGILSEMQVMKGSDEADMQLPPMPELPPFLEMLTSLFPARMKAPVVLASLPMLGTLATGVRLGSNDEEKPASLSFIVHLMAPASSGKSYVNVLKRRLMSTIDEQDKRELEAIEKERTANKQKGANERKKLTKHKLRLVAANTTMAALYQQIADSEGEHLLLCTDEIRDILKQSTSAYTNFQDILLHAFHNEEVSKSTVGDATSNMRSDVYLNSITCGTPGVTMQFFKNAEDGLVTRTLFITLPSALGERRPKYPKPNEKQQAMIDHMVDSLQQEVGFYNLPVLETAIEDYLEEARLRYLVDDDDVLANFSHRSADIGMRAGVIMWLLEGKPQDLTKKRRPKRLSKAAQRVINMAVWVAKYCQMMQYGIFGQQASDQISAVKVKPYKTQQQNIFDELPNEFTTSQINDVRFKVGLKPTSNPSVTVGRWAAQNWIVKQPDGRTWVKLYPTSQLAIQATMQIA